MHIFCVKTRYIKWIKLKLKLKLCLLLFSKEPRELVYDQIIFILRKQPINGLSVT